MGITLSSRDPFGRDVELGNVEGSRSEQLFGRNDDIDVANAEDVWTNGGTWSIPTTSTAASIVSDNANDTSAGSGVRTIRIFGLDANFDEQTEIVTMNGLTPVVTTNVYIRCHRIIALSFGSSAENEGSVTVSIDSKVQAHMAPGVNQSLQCLFTIPANKTGLLTDILGSVIPRFNASGIKEGDLSLNIRENTVGTFFRLVFEVGLSSRGPPSFEKPTFPIALIEKTDIKLRFRSHQNNARVNGGLILEIKDN